MADQGPSRPPSPSRLISTWLHISNSAGTWNALRDERLMKLFIGAQEKCAYDPSNEIKKVEMDIHRVLTAARVGGIMECDRTQHSSSLSSPVWARGMRHAGSSPHLWRARVPMEAMRRRRRRWRVKTHCIPSDLMEFLPSTMYTSNDEPSLLELVPPDGFARLSVERHQQADVSIRQVRPLKQSSHFNPHITCWPSRQ